MIVRRLMLRNFRNLADLCWSPHPFLNILSGNNAQGKTNLLEAIFFCTTGRSFRTRRDKEMIGWAGQECFAGAELEGLNSSFEISARLNANAGGRTTFLLNGRRQPRQKIFRPAMSVSFTPADLEMVNGSPSERRRWIDLDLGTFDARYQHSLESFERVMTQRNNLLKNAGRQTTRELLEPWNEQMFLYGSRVIEARIRLLKLLLPHLRKVFSVLTSGKEEISLKYLSSLPLEKGTKPEDLRRLYEETVRKGFVREAERQQTLFGPHRDDLAFFINGEDARKYGSRGQQRTLVIALKISVVKMFFGEYGDYPVVLLDDVFLELDRHRQKGLEELLEGEAQVFITSNRRLDGSFGGRGKTYTVAGGKVIGGEE